MKLKTGETVVVRGKGLVQVKSVKAEQVVFKLGKDDEFGVKTADVDARVRPVMDETTAQQVVAILSRAEGGPDQRPWGEQYEEHQKAIRTGTPIEQATLLQRLFRLPEPILPPQQRMLDVYDEVFVPEIAQALKMKVGPLKKKIRKGHPAFGYMAPDRDVPKPPKLKSAPKGWSADSAFTVFSGVLGVGESPSATPDAQPVRGTVTSVPVPCVNGVWHVLSRDDRKDIAEYALVHASVVDLVDKLIGEAKLAAVVNVEGGMIAALDGEVCADESYQKNLQYDETNGRGFVGRTGGDGGFEVHVAPQSGEAVLVYIPC